MYFLLSDFSPTHELPVVVRPAAKNNLQFQFYLFLRFQFHLTLEIIKNFISSQRNPGHQIQEKKNWNTLDFAVLLISILS